MICNHINFYRVANVGYRSALGGWLQNDLQFDNKLAFTTVSLLIDKRVAVCQNQRFVKAVQPENPPSLISLQDLHQTASLGISVPFNASD